MRKFFIVLLGVALLALGLVVLWVARGPQATEKRTTGGVLTTQDEIAQQGVAPGLAPDLGVTTDEGPSSTNIVGAPQIQDGALSDAAVMEAGEAAVRPEMAPMQPGMTTDVVLDQDTGVAVAPLSLAPEAAPADGQGGALISGVYEQRVVELEWPATFRVGGSGSIRVKFKRLADGSLQPVAEIADHEVVATPILIADRYDSYDGTVTATLSAPNFDVETVSNAAQPLTRGDEPEWRWTLQANDSGTHEIALGLNITWTPKPGVGGAPINTSIWGQTLKVEANYVFGSITVPQASIAGTALAVVGFVMQIPLADLFLGAFWKLLFGGRRRRRKSNDRRSRRR